MEEQTGDQQNDTVDSNGYQRDFLLNFNIILALGIFSIIGCWLYGFPGLIAGIVSLKYSNKVINNECPEGEDSAKNLNKVKSARIFAIAGIILSGMYLLGLLIKLIFYRTV